MIKKEFKNITFWKESDPDIVFFNYSPLVEINLDIAKEMVKNRIEFAEGKAHFCLIDFSNVKSATKESRDFMNSSEGGLKLVKAGAFLSKSTVGVFFINFYLRIYKPAVPAKFFTNKDEALSWLKKLKTKMD